VSAGMRRGGAGMGGWGRRFRTLRAGGREERSGMRRVSMSYGRSWTSSGRSRARGRGGAGPRGDSGSPRSTRVTCLCKVHTRSAPDLAKKSGTCGMLGVDELRQRLNCWAEEAATRSADVAWPMTLVVAWPRLCRGSPCTCNPRCSFPRSAVAASTTHLGADEHAYRAGLLQSPCRSRVGGHLTMTR
jgi:hypothetical protein